MDGASADFTKAIAEFSKTIEVRPDDAAAYRFRALAKRAKGDLDGAIADLSKAIELEPSELAAYVGRGSAMRAKGDLDGAIADYTQAIRLNPKLTAAYDDRGYSLYDSRAFTNALIDFRKAVELGTTNEYALFRIWLIRARAGEGEPATAELEAYLDSRASNKPDQWVPKIGHFLTGQLGEAEFLAAAKSADPKTEAGQLCEAYFYAGSKYLFAGDTASASNYFQKSIATDKTNYMEYGSSAAELQWLKSQSK